MKKILSIILVISFMASLLAFVPGCTEKSEFSYLSDYTVVYPEEYADWQKEDVYFLAEVIEKLTGKAPAVASDTSDATGKEIILAGAKREYTVDGFPLKDDELSYVVAKTGDDIVLGGNGFYANVRAIYDFINNYLGYNDLTGEKTEPAKAIDGVNVVTYTEPENTAMTYIRGRYPFGTAKDVYEFAEAGFNTVRLDASEIDTENLRRYGKWCARFGVRMIYDGLVNFKENTISTPDYDVSVNNPMIYGHYLVLFSIDYNVRSGIPDYHRYMSLIPALNYEEAFGKYGWKLVVEVPDLVKEDYWEAVVDVRNMIEENKTTGFKGTYAISLNMELPTFADERYLDDKYLSAYEFANDLKKSCGAKELWVSVYPSNRPLDEDYNSYPAMLMRNMSYGLAFGAKGIVYANYKRGIVVNADNTKGKYWDYIKSINNSFTETGKLLSDYEYKGTMIQNPDDYYPITELNDPYMPDNYNKFTFDSWNAKYGFITGCYESKDGKSYAVFGVDLKDVPEKTVEQLSMIPSTVQCSGENFRLYVDGKEADTSEFLADPKQKLVSVEPGKGVLMIADK